jgi:hypothetical protein
MKRSRILSRMSLEDQLQLAQPAPRSIAKRLHDHVVTSSGIISFVSPAYTALDLSLGKVTPQQSSDARISGAAWTYAILGLLYDEGRERTWKYFGMDERSKAAKTGFDSAYCMTFNLIFTPVVYGASMLTRGEWNMEGLAVATGWASLFGVPIGWIGGAGIDTFKGLTKIGDEKRHPAWTKHVPKPLGYGVCAGFCALSYAVLDMMYK